jgi:hypothetical protein
MNELTSRLCTFLDSVHAIYTLEELEKFIDDNFDFANATYSVDLHTLQMYNPLDLESLSIYIEKTTAYSLADLCLKNKTWALEPYGKTEYTQDYIMSFVMYKPRRR